MKKLFAAALLILIALTGTSARALHETVFAANAADAANNRLLANPPLPMLRYSPGQWKLGVAPYVYEANEDFLEMSPSGSYRQEGSYEGGGLGMTGSWAIAERWGVYALVVGNRTMGKNILRYDSQSSSPAQQDYFLSDAKATSLALSAGIVRQFFGESEDGFVLPVFAGPVVKHYNYSHRVIEKQNNGTLVSDYDVKGSGFIPGVLVGAQAGINLGKSWQLNPFAILGLLLTSEINATVPTVRVNNFPNAPGQGVNRLLSGEKPDGGDAFGGIGLNVVYRPWSLSLNVTSPFLPALIGSTDLKTNIFSLSWAFGNFKR